MPSLCASHGPILSKVEERIGLPCVVRRSSSLLAHRRGIAMLDGCCIKHHGIIRRSYGVPPPPPLPIAVSMMTADAAPLRRYVVAVRVPCSSGTLLGAPGAAPGAATHESLRGVTSYFVKSRRGPDTRPTCIYMAAIVRPSAAAAVAASVLPLSLGSCRLAERVAAVPS